MESTNHYFRPLGLIILFCLFPVWVLAQTVSVTGMVKDASGEPIIGAMPASPPMPCEPSYNLHKKAGGSPLCCFSASNVQPASFSRPGGLQSAAEVLASLIRDVGLNEL